MIVRLAIAGALLCLCGCESTPTRSPVAPPPDADVGRFVADKQPWTFQGASGWAYYTPNAVIRTTSKDGKILERLPPFVELSILHYQSDLTRLPRPKEKIETYFFEYRSQWEALTRAMMRQRAPVYLSIERGGYSAGPIGVFYDIGPRDSFVICAHEGWHQYAHSTFADPLPVWLDEGVACVMEGFRWDEQFPDHPRFLPWANTERFDQLRDAYARGSLMPVHALVTLRPQDLIERQRRSGSAGPEALTYYAQVWALVHFLREGEGGRYEPALHGLLKDAASGSLRDKLTGPGLKDFNTRRTGAATLLAYLPEGITLGQIDNEYQQFIARIVGVGGRDRVVAGQSPLSR